MKLKSYKLSEEDVKLFIGKMVKDYMAVDEISKNKKMRGFTRDMAEGAKIVYEQVLEDMYLMLPLPNGTNTIRTDEKGNVLYKNTKLE